MEKESNDNKIIKFVFHTADVNSSEDWLCIINSYIIRSRSANDKYPYIHLLWFLNQEKWTTEQLTAALRCYDIQSQPFVTAILSKIGMCLSEYKQKLLQRTLSLFNVDYSPYIPAMIPEHFLTSFPTDPMVISLLYAHHYNIFSSLIRKSLKR